MLFVTKKSECRLMNNNACIKSPKEIKKSGVNKSNADTAEKTQNKYSMAPIGDVVYSGAFINGNYFKN